MDFFQKLKPYKVKGWREKCYMLTAKSLYECVMQDSESDYNWIASATELVRICKKPDFPEEYARAIKIAILNCFANLELKQEYSGYSEPTDADAVSYCYHSLIGNNKEIIEAKRNYLTSIIRAIIKYDTDSVRFPIHHGPIYEQVCEDWENDKFHEYNSKKIIDFYKMRESLNKEFEEMIQRLEDNGTFKKEDKKWYEEKLLRFSSSIVEFDIPYRI